MEFKLNDYHRNTPDEDFLEDIKKVAKSLGKESITTSEYLSGGGKFHWSTINRRFGGWLIALQKCGFTPSADQAKKIGVSRDSMISDLQRVSGILGKKTFTTTEYVKYGLFSRSAYLRKFGSWNKSLKAAGLKPFDHPLGGGTKNKVTQIECFEEIEKIWIELGRQPTTIDIKKGCSKYSLHIYERRFGSWRKALEAFVSYINSDQEIEEIKDEHTSKIQTSESENCELIHKTKRDISLKMRFMVMKRDDFKCCLCGRSPATTPGLELHIDHIIPWSKGGETVIDNLQTLCSDCNLGKSDLL